MTPSQFFLINKNQIFKNKNRARHSSGKRIEPKCEVHKMETPLGII